MGYLGSGRGVGTFPWNGDLSLEQSLFLEQVLNNILVPLYVSNIAVSEAH